MSSNIVVQSIDMVNQLFYDGEYREAMKGLLLIKKSKPYGNNNKFNMLINNLIDECIKKLKEREQEDRDARQLAEWRKNTPSKEVQDLLDANLPGWRNEEDEEDKSMS